MSDLLSLWDLYQKQKEMAAILSSHNHDASNLTGLSNIATSGSFDDLKNVPDIANTVNGKTGKVVLTPEDIKAIPSDASCNKNWNYLYKTAQPTYLWGCNDNIDMYLYNPSNFRVYYAANAGMATSAINASSATMAKNANKVANGLTIVNKNDETIVFDGSEKIDLSEGVNHSNTSSALVNNLGEKYTLDELISKINDAGGDIVGKKMSFSETKHTNVADTRTNVLTYSNDKGGMIRWFYSTIPNEGTNTYLVVDGELVLDAVPTSTFVSCTRDCRDSLGSRFLDIPFKETVTIDISVTNILDKSFVLYNGFTFYTNK